VRAPDLRVPACWGASCEAWDAIKFYRHDGDRFDNADPETQTSKNR
jgi:hypothetical protein